MFTLSQTPLKRDDLMEALSNEGAGAIVVFEGWVRNHNHGKQVSALEYQVYEELALKEGSKILHEAKEKFNLHAVKAVHRYGYLHLGETAIWIGATASHRDDAFKATRFIIDEIKQRLPVWKKEHYTHEPPQWVFCKHHQHHVHFVENDYYLKQQKLVSQDQLKAAKVLVIGAGGLGCPVLISLAQAGVGKLGMADFDRIHISNIHRQSLYSPHLAGEKKVNVAKARLLELNPLIQVECIETRIDVDNVINTIQNYDLIIDSSDNMQTKYVVHDACLQQRLPLISASIFKHEGQIRTFLPESEYGCLRCHVNETPQDHLLGNCNDFGVLGASVNMLGSLQASEAIHFLQDGSNSTLTHTLLMNFKDLTQLKIKNSRRSCCQTCEGNASFIPNQIEVDSMSLQKEKALLLDIRNLTNSDIEAYKHEKMPVILYCHRGFRSLKLAQDLRAAGHAQFYSLKGGACSL
jgi:sulfur-carrier protein adenylyltransferase/sulfurtransferase